VNRGSRKHDGDRLGVTPVGRPLQGAVWRVYLPSRVLCPATFASEPVRPAASTVSSSSGAWPEERSVSGRQRAGAQPGGEPVGAASEDRVSKFSERGPERDEWPAAGRYLSAGGATPRPMPSWLSRALVWGRGGQSPSPLVVSARTWGCVPRGSRTTRVVPGSTSSPPSGGSDWRRSPGRPAACRGA
jgi:hypothetical protein